MKNNLRNWIVGIVIVFVVLLSIVAINRFATHRVVSVDSHNFTVVDNVPVYRELLSNGSLSDNVYTEVNGSFVLIK